MTEVYTDGKDKDFIELCEMLDMNLDEIVGGRKQREQYDQYNTLEDIHDVVLIYDEETPVGCASFKLYDRDTAEVKRVFVRKEHRGKGIGKQLMTLLEKRAKDKGFGKLILETGAPLVEAMALYKAMNYEITEHYGQYKNMKDSICMQKNI